MDIAKTWSLQISLLEDNVIIYDIMLEDCHAGTYDGETAAIGQLSVSRLQNWEYWIQFYGFFLKQETIKLGTFTQATVRINKIINDSRADKQQDSPVKNPQIKINHDILDILARVIGVVEDIKEEIQFSSERAEVRIEECLSYAKSQVNEAREATETLEKEEQE